MALKFTQCRQCGGRTQINTRVSAEARRCVLCGGQCCEEDSIEAFEIPAVESLAEKPLAYAPVELMEGTCPHCFTKVAVDPARMLAAQRCHACGFRLVKKRKIDREKAAEAPDAEEILFPRAKERVWLPIAGIALVFIFGGIWALWMGTRPETKPAELTAAEPPGDEEQIKALVTKFTAAKSADELLLLVREPEKYAAAVKSWIVTHTDAIPPGGEFAGLGPSRIAFGTRLYQVALSYQRDAHRQTILLAALTKTGWRVDWLAFTGVGDISFEEFTVSKPSRPVLMLSLAQRSSYYNGDYANENIWQSLRVTDRLDGPVVHAYVPRRDVALMEKLNVLPAAPREGGDMPATSRRLALKLHFANPDSARLGLAEVTAIEGDGWFIP